MSFLRSLADDFSDFLREQPVWSLIYFSAFYFGCTLSSSRKKQFWYDELFTYHMSRLPDWKTILAALGAGADLNPPPIYFLTRLSHSIFGMSEVATRLPATLGFLLMLICLYGFIANRTGRPIAFAAILFPMVTGAYRWATEARTYGVILGLVAAASLFWQRAGRTAQPSRAACVGVGLCLTAAVTTQAYGIVSVGPFLLAEFVRFRQTRETRWPVWVALLAPFAALAVYVPLLSAHNDVALDNPVFRPELASIASFYHMLLDPAVFPLALVLAFALWSRLPNSTERPSEQEGVPAEEIALAAGFLLVPVIAVGMAMAVTRVFMDRYGLPAIIGTTMILAFLMARVPSRTAPLFSVVVFAGWCAAGVITLPRTWPLVSGAPTAEKNIPKLQEIRPDLPMVVSNGLWFLPLVYYSESSLSRRLTYLFDRKSALQYTGSDVFEFGYPVLKKWHNIAGRIEPYGEFLARGKPFLLYGPMSPFPLDWVVKKLIDDGASVKIISIRPEGFLCEVTPPQIHR